VKHLVSGRAAVLVSVMTLVSGVVSAQEGGGLRPQPGLPSSQMPVVLQNVEFAQRLNERLPLDLAFVDEDGRQVRLGDYFSRKPVVLAFVYYECPMLCSQVLNGVTSALAALDEAVGRDFEVVAVSFDPRDTPIAAAAKKKSYVDRYNRLGSERGFHFLTGSEASVKALTAAAGFKYAWDEETQQFAHASGFVVATPQGTLSRYFFGIEYAPRDVKFALVESSAGRVGSVVDQVLLYCYHYDPKTGSYSFVALKAVQLGGALTLLALGGFVFVAIRREHRVGY
jgi:protein SCO1/2